MDWFGEVAWQPFPFPFAGLPPKCEVRSAHPSEPGGHPGDGRRPGPPQKATRGGGSAGGARPPPVRSPVRTGAAGKPRPELASHAREQRVELWRTSFSPPLVQVDVGARLRVAPRVELARLQLHGSVLVQRKIASPLHLGPRHVIAFRRAQLVVELAADRRVQPRADVVAHASVIAFAHRRV